MDWQVARQLLAAYGGTAPWVGHCEAVARAVGILGAALARVATVDTAFARRAALLHDLGRCRTHDPVAHGVAGFRILHERGYPAEAFVCVSHVLWGLTADEAAAHGLPRRRFAPVTLEQRLVPLADFLVEGDAPTTLAARFASLRARNRGNSAFLARLGDAETGARRFGDAVDRMLGEGPEELLRRCWDRAEPGG